MEEIRDRVAGLDVHRDQVVACVRVAEGRHVKTVKRSFPTTTAGVAELGAWLVHQGAGTEGSVIVAESTYPRVGC